AAHVATAVGAIDGVEASDPVFDKALRKLANANPGETYDLALRLLVMEAHPAFPDRLDTARADSKELLRHRDGTGGFSYGPGANNWDLSNTQYAALGLRAAKAIGVQVDRGIWTKMAKEVGDQQDSYGGFGYQRRSSGFDSYASMTAAGIAVLAICRQALDEEREGTTLHKQIGRGWLWFARNVDAIGSTQERWSYYHYGLERAAILCDVEKIDEQDWYVRGAEMLCSDQLPGGGWSSRSDGFPGNMAGRGRGTSVSTSFAVLFLRRKFQKVSGPVTPRDVTLAAVGSAAREQDIADCVAELKRRGKGAMPDVLHALRSEVEPRRRAAARGLEAIAGEHFGFDPARDAEANREAIKKAELWHLRNR
ncbi:MAG: terpene cyclase/mutase family protein, partial [Planctomycetota bacterium]|nr:terpene cyclase/mutase family protein [Planctomycetota bacterium]